MTTTSSGAGAVEQWFSWWLADWKLDVQLCDVTQALCAVNLAGPRAREILARLTDADCSPEAFAYLDSRQARVAGVQALLMRIGFVGELGYEIHFPAAYGEDVWNAILIAGESRGHPAVRPRAAAHPAPAEAAHHRRPGHRLGVDAVRRGHAVGGQARQGRAFIGKWALAHAAEAPAETALVGFTRRRRPGADRGRGGARRARRRGRAGDQRAPLAPARTRDRDGVGAERARERRPADHDRRQRRAPARARSSPSRSTTPPGSCCAREPRPSSPPTRRSRARYTRARRWSAWRWRPARGLPSVDGWNVPNAYCEPTTEHARLARERWLRRPLEPDQARAPGRAARRSRGSSLAQPTGWCSSRGSPAAPRPPARRGAGGAR